METYGIAIQIGTTWQVNSCLTCTCLHDEVLCEAKNCPPAPCPESDMEQEPKDCCPRCSSSKGRKLEKIETNESTSRTCYSNDDMKEYQNGESWKVCP